MKLKTGKWNQESFGVAQDTSVERRTILAVGSRGSSGRTDDRQLNTFSGETGNRYFSSVYGVATKHFQSGGHDLAFTFGWNIPFRKSMLFVTESLVG